MIRSIIRARHRFCLVMRNLQRQRITRRMLQRITARMNIVTLIILFRRRTILRIRLLTSRMQNTRRNIRPMILLHRLMIRANHNNVKENNIRLCTLILTRIRRTMHPIRHRTIRRIPTRRNFRPRGTLLTRVNMLRIMLRIMSTPCTLSFVARVITMNHAKRRRTIITMLNSRQRVVILFQLRILISTSRRRTRVIPIRRRFLSAQEAMSRQVINTSTPPFIKQVLNNGLKRPRRARHLQRINARSNECRPLKISNPLILRRVLHFFRNTNFRVIINVTKRAIKNRFIQHVFRARSRTIPIRMITHSNRTQLPSTALMILITHISTLIPLRTIMGINVGTAHGTRPILRIMNRLNSHHPIAHLTRDRILCRIVHIRRRNTPMGRSQRIVNQIMVRFLKGHSVLLTLSTRQQA